MEIEIPVSLTDDLLRFAFEMQIPVEVIVEQRFTAGDKNRRPEDPVNFITELFGHL